MIPSQMTKMTFQHMATAEELDHKEKASHKEHFESVSTISQYGCLVDKVVSHLGFVEVSRTDLTKFQYFLVPLCKD
jgi:hypothetical protein